MSKRSARGKNTGDGGLGDQHSHDIEDLTPEDRAKGHEKRNGGPGLREEPEISDPHTERGHQKGYGKNQDDEGKSRHTRWGTRAPGSEHG